MRAIKNFLSDALATLPAVMVALLSLLPFRLLYIISDGFCILLWAVVGYRRKVVLSNLQKAFPHHTREENNRIALKFYRHLADLIFETIALVTVSKERIRKKILLTGESRSLLNRYHAQGRSAIMALGHYGNWEWMGPAINLINDGQLVSAYRRLRIKPFDYLLRKTRLRFYRKLVPSAQLLRKMVSMKSAGEPAIFALLADQWPPPGTAYWMQFLGQDTPFFTGPEKLGKKLDHPVLFCSIRKTGRGRYSMHITELSVNPRSEPEMEITRRYVKLLEAEICHAPEYWLWSHRRWKWQRPLDEQKY